MAHAAPLRLVFLGRLFVILVGRGILRHDVVIDDAFTVVSALVVQRCERRLGLGLRIVQLDHVGRLGRSGSGLGGRRGNRRDVSLGGRWQCGRRVVDEVVDRNRLVVVLLPGDHRVDRLGIDLGDDPGLLFEYGHARAHADEASDQDQARILQPIVAGLQFGVRIRQLDDLELLLQALVLARGETFDERRLLLADRLIVAADLLEQLLEIEHLGVVRRDEVDPRLFAFLDLALVVRLDLDDFGGRLFGGP